MQPTLLRTATVLIIGAGLVLGGNLIYNFFLNIFEANSIPLIIRLAVVAGGLGFVLLFLYIIWDRIRQIRGENPRDRDRW